MTGFDYARLIFAAAEDAYDSTLAHEAEFGDEYPDTANELAGNTIDRHIADWIDANSKDTGMLDTSIPTDANGEIDRLTVSNDAWNCWVEMLGMGHTPADRLTLDVLRGGLAGLLARWEIERRQRVAMAGVS